MKSIGGISGPAAATARRAARPGSGFALPGARAVPAGSAAAAPEGIAALLAVQDEAACFTSAREAPLRRAALALDALRGLQLDLLRGGGDSARLERLAALVAVPDAVAEPGLAPLLAEIRLRARVELARHHAQKASAPPR